MRCTCGKCDISFASISDYQQHICGMEIKMTREEAHTIAFNLAKNLEGKEINQILKILEALGLLKFDEPKKEVKHIISVDVRSI